MPETEKKTGWPRGKQITRSLQRAGRRVAIGLVVCVMMAYSMPCRADGQKVVPDKRLQVVTSLFPLYDFSRNIGLDRADVSLLLPPGLEPHSFEPRPNDMVRLHRADILIFTNSAMEPWVADVLRGVKNPNLKIVEAGRGIDMMAVHETHGQGKKTRPVAHAHDKKAIHRHDAGHHHDHHGGGDPHIWLDFDNAARMVDHILAGFSEKDPPNRAFYESNAVAYKAKLDDLDRQFKKGLSGCRKDTIVQGGHFAFGYLARRYGFKYATVSGLSPNAEPTPAAMVAITRTLRENGLNHLFYEELLSPRVAEAIARETGASLRMLYPAGNVGKADFERGIGFMDLMQRNLQHLREGLQCPQP